MIFLGFCQILNFVHIYFIFRTFRSFYFVAIKIERDKLGSLGVNWGNCMGVYKNVLKDFQTFLKVFRGV